MGLFTSSTSTKRIKTLVTPKDVDVAVSKATRSYLPDLEPKEKHVIALKSALEDGPQRSYVAVSLLNRLHAARDWVTAVKTSVVIHRLLKETRPPTIFWDELCRAGGADANRPGRTRVYPLHMDGFLDTNAAEGRYNFSEWVRAYCKYIDESLDAYWHTSWYADLGKSGDESPMRDMAIENLLETLPRVQRVQRRLFDCCPTGIACQNDNTLLGLSLVVQESFKLHKAVSAGIFNLADKFFQMDYHQGVKALETYNEACVGFEDFRRFLSDLGQLDAVKRVVAAFPTIETPPRDFLEVMKDRLKELRQGVTTETRKEPLRLRREVASVTTVDSAPLSLSSPLAQVDGGEQVDGNAAGVVPEVVPEVNAEEAVAVGEDAGEPNLLDFGDPGEGGGGGEGGGEDVYSLLSSLDFFGGGTTAATTATNNNPFV